ncbi:hypothetical protein HMPREF1032_02563 [Subdoligranulum sp. 4_3_54A2FAA]|jgi:histidine kinase|uniref:cache domain-containing sensor histidine kinase n=1 Tax=Ruthenibacterium lactatiformans TaxID=1550024 RepID=UPI000240EBB7|nr:sensor histidine kinase [Ruthenibacterium lactatiformans]EHL73070.1 hypothetical protein HMPREF1032_02563 [Subdoligranulum sp. 4_3_54A2FAA]
MKKKPFFFSLRYKLQCIILLLVALPLVVVAGTAYMLNARSLSERIMQSNATAANKTATALEYMLEDLKNNSLELFQQSAVYHYLTADNKAASGAAALNLSGFLTNHLTYDKYISELHVLREDGLYFRSGSAYGDLTDSQKRAADESNGHLTFVGQAERGYFSIKEAYVFARRVRDVNDLSKTLGYVQLCVPVVNFTQLLDSGGVEQMENMLVENGNVIIASEQIREGKSVVDLFGKDFVLAGAEGTQQAQLEDKVVQLTYYRLNYPNWYLVSSSPLSGMGQREQQFSFLMMLVTLCAVLFIVSAILARLFSAMVLRPLTTVTDSMKRLEENNYDLTISEAGNDETAVLACSFNKMSRRIHELLNDVYLFQLREKDAQIKALQAYINPHFLYNTFDTICWMSRMEDAPETCRLVEALSQLFRSAVETDSRVVSVSKELEYTHNYLMIQECRYSDTIDFQLEVEDGLENCETVNFALQPLIENAIFHGIEPKGATGSIRVQIYSEQGCLIYRVSDDGIACDVEEVNRLLESYSSGKRGFAIAGLHSRIQLCFGKKYGLHFEANETGGLTAVVIQPLRKEQRTNAEIDDC